MMSNSSRPPVAVATFYRFVALPDYRERQPGYLTFLRDHGLKGTVLLAAEGINGTISGDREAIAAWFDFLRQEACFRDLQYRLSYEFRHPFYRTKVKLKKEIVTLGVPGVDPNRRVGEYIDPHQWNELISRPDVVLIDTRNDYEYEVGTFVGAVNPRTQSFRQFPAFVQRHLDPATTPRVAMFCTGGIRCEKATSYMLSLGFPEVYHLRGGILNYLEQIPDRQSLWRGECFVFDHRVTVDHHLNAGKYEQCHACRRPVSPADMASPYYQRGVSCPKCYDEKTPEDRSRYHERQRQITLAESRRQPHLGVPMETLRQ